MRLTDLTQHAGQWLRGAGPDSEIVISSRVRLARNVAGEPFLTRCDDSQRRRIAERLHEAVEQAAIANEMLYVDVEAASDLDRQLLVERHLISRQHAQGSGARAVVVTGDETAAVMINEEDHLRVQVLRSGLQLADSYEQIDRVDDALAQRVHFAFSGRFGYLTACPTNVGTGIRVSVMLHLPALKMSGQIEKVFQAASDMRLAIRGLYGEGTEAMGDLFQISNQTTLGQSEREIISEFNDRIVPGIIEFEREARRSLLATHGDAMEDKAFRSLSLLRSARLMSSEETMGLLSQVRLGIHLGRVQDITLQTVNELLQLTQPAHLQQIHGRAMDAAERARVRAEFIRQRLN